MVRDDGGDSLKPLFSIIVLLLSISTAFAACPDATNNAAYVTAAGSGSKTGADWSNTFSGFGTGAGQANPGSLVRGCTYYVATGSYNVGSITTFSTALSGTTKITIQAPTVAGHGTATGWSNTFVGQAEFGPLVFSTGHWVLNGAYRSTATGKPSTDWRLTSGYGFMVENNNGSNHPVSSNGGIYASDYTNGDYTIEYTYIDGSHDSTGTYTDNGIQFPVANLQTGTTASVLYCYIYGVGDVPISVDTYTTLTVKYTWLQNNQSTGTNHGEGMALRGVANVIAGYNYLENLYGTGVIGTPYAGSGTPNVNEWDFFSNVLFFNSSESITGGSSYAIIQFWQFNWQTLAFYNNTIYQIGDSVAGNDACELLNGGGSGWTAQNVIFRNNLVASCPGGSTVVSGSQLVTVTYDHNSYFNNGTVNDSGTGVQITSSAPPFTSTSTNDFTLTSDTSARVSVSDPNGYGFNTDLLGNTLTSSRGAFQFQSATYTITVSSITGNGTVTSSDSVLNCTTGTTGTCTDSTASGTVTLTFTPSSGYTLSSVTGCTLSGNTCSVSATATVTATFTALPASNMSLSGPTMQGVVVQ